MKRHRMVIPAFVTAINLFVALSASAQLAKEDTKTEKPAATNMSGPKVVEKLPPPPTPSCGEGEFKCSENKIDAQQCMKATPTSKEGPDAEVKWRVLFSCPFGCVEGESKTAKPSCAKVTKKKKKATAKQE